MANNKQINARLQMKHDIEANWIIAGNATNPFVPKSGELIIYDVDDNHNSPRIKIGDGDNNVNELPFFVDETKADKSELKDLIYYVELDTSNKGIIENYHPIANKTILFAKFIANTSVNKGSITINNLEPLPITYQNQTYIDQGFENPHYWGDVSGHAMYLYTGSHYQLITMDSGVDLLLIILQTIFKNYMSDFGTAENPIPDLKTALEMFFSESIEPLETSFSTILQQLYGSDITAEWAQLPSIRNIANSVIRENKDYGVFEEYKHIEFNSQDVDEYIVIDEDETNIITMAKSEEYYDLQSVICWDAYTPIGEDKETIQGTEIIYDEYGNWLLFLLDGNGDWYGGMPGLIGIKQTNDIYPIPSGVYHTVVFNKSDNAIKSYLSRLDITVSKIQRINPEYLPDSIGYETKDTLIIGPSCVHDYPTFSAMVNDGVTINLKKLSNTPLKIDISSIQFYMSSLTYKTSNYVLMGGSDNSPVDILIDLVYNEDISLQYGVSCYTSSMVESGEFPLLIVSYGSDWLPAGLYSIALNGSMGSYAIDSFISKIIGLQEDKIHMIDPKYLPTDNITLITLDDIDAICGQTIELSDEVLL